MGAPPMVKAMGRACSYCGSDVERHDPVYVEEVDEDGRVDAGAFCNYACLTAHIDEAGLTAGASCEWSPPT
ncbi:MAG: hypothetical protein ACOC0X_03215 [Halobacteriota archaeon]